MSLINNNILVSDANNFSVDYPINPHYQDQPLNKENAIKEHASVLEFFSKAGIKVHQVPSPTDSQDGIYTANWALVRGDTAVLARLPNARKAEENYAEKILTQLGKKVIKVPGNYKFSGQGDSLPCGKYLLAGSGYRSDPEAQQFAADILGYELIQLQTVPHVDSKGETIINQHTGWPDSFFYDIDLALAVIREDLIAYCKDAFSEESNRIIESLPINKIVVSLDEAMQGFACNLVSTGQNVIMSNNAPQLQANLIKNGLSVQTANISELSKGGGFIRCISLTID